MPDAWVLAGVRTPRGKASAKGGLHGIAPVRLVGALLDALADRGVQQAAVDDLLLGCATQVDAQGANLARTAALLAGWDVPGATVNRFCASGLEAAPTYVLHFANAYEDGDEIVLDGFFQSDPAPRPDPADGVWGPLKKMVDMNAMGTRLHRWRFDLRTGRTREESLGEPGVEFPTIHGRFGGRPYRYTVCATGKPGWFLFDGLIRYDLHTGATQRFRFPDGVYGSEAPVAPRAGGAEDDGWVVTFISDVRRDVSECWVFDAAHVDDGPIARVALPERISSGTHACWAPTRA